MVVSFISETRVIQRRNALLDCIYLDQVENSGFLETESTLFSGFCLKQGLLQVTLSTVRLLNAKTLQLVSEYSLKDVGGITHCTLSSPSSLILSTGSRKLVKLDLKMSGLSHVQTVELDEHVAALESTHSALIIASWTTTGPATLKYMNHNLELLESSTVLPTTSLIRSLLVCSLEGNEYLFVATGDGDLYTMHFNPTNASTNDLKKTNLGTQPIKLRLIKPHSNGSSLPYVFASSSDRPTIIHSRAGKLLFSLVNLRHVVDVCLFNCGGTPLLCLATDQTVTLGKIEAVQKLHVKSVLEGESCIRIVEWRDSFVAGSVYRLPLELEVDSSEGQQLVKSRVVLVDSNTFEGIFFTWYN